MNILLDTNILVYAYDPADLPRQRQAIEILDHLYLRGNAVLSIQVLAEFVSVVIRPLRGMPPRLTVDEAMLAAQRYIDHFDILPLTPMTILEAGRGVRDHQLAYYDAQIWATARLNQVAVLFSEDFSDGVTLEGVHFVNPFTSHFMIGDWA